MHNSFISIVTPVATTEDIQRLSGHLASLHSMLEASFSDYEIILVNNTGGREFGEIIEPLPAALKQNIFMLNLSTPVNRNHAFVAGLDRSNGDYTVIFEMDFCQHPEYVLKLYEESVKGSDIVYLRAKKRRTKIRFRLFYKLFYWILRTYSKLSIDDHAHDSRIISRRALNSLLRLRENLRYMKAIYSIVGYRTTFLETDIPLQADQDSFNEKFRTSLVAITSFTSFLRSVLLWIFLSSILFMLLVIFNAVKVKMTNVDIFGDVHEAIPGWTFLVVLTSIFFAITCLMLYIMSIYLSNIYQEIKHRPMYIIESVKRFA
ncbi:MAG: glycosyltransferase [Lewinellaceae bacterium]|nr:glycosyltransferase [Saprospiraceae bacterium]MCB9340544.1 glycosyltransferase [Lewinellaceae bacterium]